MFCMKKGAGSIPPISSMAKGESYVKNWRAAAGQCEQFWAKWTRRCRIYCKEVSYKPISIP